MNDAALQPTGFPQSDIAALIKQRVQIRYYSHLNLVYRFNVAESYGMLILSLFRPVESGTPPSDNLYMLLYVFFIFCQLFFVGWGRKAENINVIRFKAIYFNTIEK